MAATILPVQLESLDQNLEKTISWTSELLSSDSEVVSGLENGSFSQSLTDRLDTLLKDSEDINYIVIADTAGSRLYHPDHSLIGQSFVGGDETDILQGNDPYITTQKGATDIQKRAFHAVRDENGSIIGFIMTSASMTTIQNAQRKVIFQFILIFLLVLFFGILTAWLLSASIRKSLLGFEPGTFARRYLQREEILDSLDEGVLAVDTEGKYLYSNEAARKLFKDTPFDSQKGIRSCYRKCLESGKSITGQLVEISGNTVLINMIPMIKLDRIAGVLIISRDKTDITDMAEQLTGTNHIIEALRASTHEYMNKLHVISGLLQIGETENAITYIDGVSTDIEKGYHSVTAQIHNKTIAALILGKQDRARELDIDFTLRKDASLPEHNPYLSIQELVTIVGNLVENAFDAVKGLEGIRQVDLFIGSDTDGITVSVDDTGHGLTDDQIRSIRQSQYSTKGTGHGVGLRLIQQIVHEHQGFLEIESEPGEGSSFTIIINKKRF
ncbi:MAG: ATP-binding protein [Eubacteriaceae bacterium]